MTNLTENAVQIIPAPTYSLETSSVALLRRQVIDTFEGLLLSLKNLDDALLQDSHLMAWLNDCSEFITFPEGVSIRQKISQILSQVEYLSTQAPREIIVYAGFVGASQHTLEIVNQLNTQKEAFKQAILSLKKIKLSIHDDLLTTAFEHLLSHKRNLPTASNLKNMGLSRLHLKQCYRKIPILNDTPLKISWTWANTRSIKRVSVLEAEKLLKKRNLSDEGIQLQLKKLASLPHSETLAIVQDLAPHLRANLVMAANQPKERLMVKGPVPIFFPATPNQPWPEFKPPKIKMPKDKARVIRNDVRLDPNPFLPAIRAHRYLDLS
jgi:hypothetical protein